MNEHEMPDPPIGPVGLAFEEYARLVKKEFDNAHEDQKLQAAIALVNAHFQHEQTVWQREQVMAAGQMMSKPGLRG